MKVRKYPICEDIKSYTIQKQNGNIHFDIKMDYHLYIKVAKFYDVKLHYDGDGGANNGLHLS
jgi:hypothetical protein